MPWVRPDGEPVPGVNLPIIPENEPLDLSESQMTKSQVTNDSEFRWEMMYFQLELSPLDQNDSIEFEEDSYVSPSRRSPVRTRVGRAVKPKQIYSP